MLWYLLGFATGFAVGTFSVVVYLVLSVKRVVDSDKWNDE